MKPEWLDLLACPETHQALGLAGRELLQSLNSRAHAGQLRNRGGKSVEGPLDGGLLRQDGQVLYPIYHELPLLLVEEGIEIG